MFCDSTYGYNMTVDAMNVYWKGWSSGLYKVAK